MLEAVAPCSRASDRAAALLVTPYLGWLALAGWLNGGIVALNRDRLDG